MANLEFPLQFKRQYAGSLDVDEVFKTRLEMEEYLNDPVRYPGQVVTCLEEEGSIFILNKDRDKWISSKLVAVTQNNLELVKKELPPQEITDFEIFEAGIISTIRVEGEGQISATLYADEKKEYYQVGTNVIYDIIDLPLKPDNPIMRFETTGEIDYIRIIGYQASQETKEPNMLRKHFETIIGDGSTEEFTITHALNSKNVIVQVDDDEGTVETHIKKEGKNNAKLKFDIAPQKNKEYQVTIIG